MEALAWGLIITGGTLFGLLALWVANQCTAFSGSQQTDRGTVRALEAARWDVPNDRTQAVQPRLRCP
jgi:hypothetical protein